METGYVVLSILGIISGIGILIKSADYFVDASSEIAKKLKISPLIIGLTIVAIGTSLPEFAVSLTSGISAFFEGKSADISLSNIIGSNIVNSTLILGLSVIITPIAVSKAIRKRDYPFMLLVTILLVLFMAFFQKDHVIVWQEALVLLLLFMLFMILLIKSTKKVQEEPVTNLDKERIPLKKALLLLLVGIAGIVLGAEALTRSAKYIGEGMAISLGLDQSLARNLIGATVVALGTSLPELVTSVSAAKKGENEIAIGNIIGSNIFNITLIVGLTGVITPLSLNSALIVDGLILIAISLILGVAVLTKKIKKYFGVLLVSIYACYLIFIILRLFTSS